MIELKYEKTFPACAVSHIDLLRVMIRLLYRSQTKVDFSVGYNPHMLLFFSPPLTVGVQSKCEYMTVATDFDSGLIDRLNNVAPKGIRFCKIFEVNKKPNLAGVVTKADYIVKAKGIGKIDISQFLSGEYTIEYESKGQKVIKNVADMIFSVEKIDEDALVFRLACGNINLRIDRLVKSLCLKNGLNFDDCCIEKTAMFVGDKNADEYLSTLK